MEFVPDAALDRRYGKDLMDEIRASIHPTGDCAICQNPLGERPVRIKAYGPGHSMASFVPTHASCGPSADAGDVLVAPPLTWETAWLLRGFETRDAFGLPVHADMPLIAINPSVDVQGSNETSAGVWTRPIDLFHKTFKFASAIDRHPSQLPGLPEHAAAAWSGTFLQITLTEPWTVAIDERFVRAVKARDGFLLAASHRVTPKMLMTDPVNAFDQLVSPAGTSAFAWVPRQHIKDLTP